MKEKETKGTVDRIEGGWVVLVTGGERFDIPRGIFPEGVSEGDVVALGVEVLEKETGGLKREVAERLERLKEKGGGGDGEIEI